jgi:hypothetical protein
MRKVIASVGGSIGWAGSGCVTSGAQIVCDTVASGRPAIATMSPADASSTAGAVEAAEGEHLGEATLLDQATGTVEHLDGLVGFDRARADAAGDDAAEIGIGLENGSEHAERSLLDGRFLHVPGHQIEQRRHALILRPVGGGRHPAFLGGAVEDGKIELFLAGIEGGKEVEHFVHDHGRPRIRPVHLVDHHNGLEADLERLGHHELGLRQRALGGVHQDQRAVHHVEDALHFAAEIGMAWGVDDVDAGAVPVDRGDLGENGDAAFAFEIVGIHRPFRHALVLAEGAGLLQQAIDQSGLAMVDVGDDRQVAQRHKGNPVGPGRARATLRCNISIDRPIATSKSALPDVQAGAACPAPSAGEPQTRSFMVIRGKRPLPPIHGSERPVETHISASRCRSPLRRDTGKATMAARGGRSRALPDPSQE